MASYSRLFGEAFPGHDETALEELAARMKDIPDNRRNRRRGGELVVSGLVYLGQFIDHDLTLDNTPLAQADTPPQARTNLRRPLLDLDSLYGDGPGELLKLYDLSKAGSERFLVGETQPAGGLSATLDDIPIDEHGVSVMVDQRNEENLIIAQLHVAFLQSHNRAVQYFADGRVPDAARYGSTPFQQARRFVTWHYQWIVRNEFLSRMVLDDVFNDVVSNGPKIFNPKQGDEIALPVEFTHAAFRFGHSMVQNVYRLSQTRVVNLQDLLKQTPAETPREKLNATDVLDWYFFITRTGQLPNFADNIDTLISCGLYDLPHSSIRLFSATAPLALPTITLLRGSRAGLPSGQEACERYGIPPLPSENVGFDAEMCSFLEKNGMLKRTPLWYYILREAEVLGAKDRQRKQRNLGGECLGPLGSQIVTEVLLGLMNSDSNHYLNSAPKWEPPNLVFGNSAEPRQIAHLRDLIAFAKSRD